MSLNIDFLGPIKTDLETLESDAKSINDKITEIGDVSPDSDLTEQNDSVTSQKTEVDNNITTVESDISTIESEIAALDPADPYYAVDLATLNQEKSDKEDELLNLQSLSSTLSGFSNTISDAQNRYFRGRGHAARSPWRKF